ncbi:MAG: ATP-binding cassette domain-containing protein, partial [Rhodoferax sp.]|nr:ATP-binding cassette domain-containing protein [Rhodoferax sp.]
MSDTAELAMPKIKLDGATKKFGSGVQSRLALDQVSLSVATGETVTVIGPTGCGKTTILNMVAGFTSPSQGKVLVDGKQVTGPGPDRGFMF